MIRKTMNFFMLSCKKATELVEKRSVSPLGLRHQLQLKMHLSMCAACHAYEKQSEAMDKAISRLVKSEGNAIESLSEDSKVKIISKIIES